MKKTDKDLLEEIFREARVEYYRSKPGNSLVIPDVCAFEFASTDALLGVVGFEDDDERQYDGSRYPMKYKQSVFE